MIVISVLRIVRERNAAIAAGEHADAARREATARNEELVLLQARAELSRDPTASLAWLKRYPEAASGWPAAANIAADAWSRGAARSVWNLGVPLGSVAFSRDGRTVGAGGTDGTLALIDVESGERRTYRAPDGVGGRVVFSPDGRRIATTDGVRFVRLWDTATGESTRLAGEPVGGPHVAFSPDGSMLLVRHTGGGARLWRVPSGEPVELPGDDSRLLAFVPGGTEMVLARGAELALFDVGSGAIGPKVRLDGPAYDLQVSGDGRWVAASRPGSLTLWEPSRGTVRKISVGKDAVRLLVPSADGRRFVSCGSAGSPELWVFDTAVGTGRQLSTGERCTRQAFEFSPDATLFVSTGYGGELRVHGVSEGRTALLAGHESTVTDAAFSPDGKLLVSASSDRTVRVWRIGEGDVRVLHDVEGLDGLSAGNQVLVQDSASGATTLMDARTGKARPLASAGKALRSRGALSLDGRIALTYEAEAKLVLWDLTDLAGATHRTLDLSGGSTTGVMAEALSAHGTRLAQLDGAGAVLLVDLATGHARELARLGDRGFAVAWSRDERLVAAGGRDGTARVWDAATGAEKARIRVGGWVWGLALSRDASQLAAACTDGIVRVLSIGSGQVIDLAGHVGTAASVDFMPDGKRVISSGADGTVRIWDLATRVGTVVRREPGSIYWLALSPDASLVMMKSDSNSVRIWDASVIPPLGATPSELVRWAGSVTSAQVDPQGQLQTQP